MLMVMTSQPSPGKVDLVSAAFLLLATGLGAVVGLLIPYISNPFQLLVLVVGLLAALAIIARREFGILALVVIVYTRFSDVAISFHGAPSVFQPFMLLLIAVIFIRWVLYKERPRGWQRSLALVAGYGLVGFASLLYASDFSRAQNALGDYAKDAIIVVVVALMLQRGALLRTVIWAMLAAGIFLGSISVFQQASGTFDNNYWGFGQAAVKNILSGHDDYRISGPIGDANFYAQILVVLVPLALERLWGERGRVWRLLAVWALGVSLLSIVFTYSRGAFLALVVVVGLMVIRRPPRPVIMLLTMLLIVAIWRFVPESYVDRLSTIPKALPLVGASTDPEVSFRGRTSEMAVGWRMFIDNPITGVGLDNYPVFYQQYSRLIGLDPRREPRAPHNLYLQIASETGLLGVTMFGAILWFAFRGMWQAERALSEAGRGELAGMIAAFSVGLGGYLVGGIFLHAAYPRYLWLLIGIALAVPQLARSELAVQYLTADHRSSSAAGQALRQ
jgi:putative inorganic carbon (hco3(-)) transporter